MKNPNLIAIAVLLLSSCVKIKQVGRVNMISNRNVESQVNYVSIKNYMGGSKKELKRMKAKTIEQAIDNVVRNTPGGEFLKNVKIYTVNTKYYAVEGDVWGLPSNFKGFKVGDNVQWKDLGRTFQGVVVDLKDENKATVKDDEGKLKQVKYSDLLKMQ